MDKAKILEGASKYIEKFKNSLFVIKCGGTLLDDETALSSILEDIITLHQNRIDTVFVHGGGSAISRLMKQRGKEPSFVKGIRVTDEETVGIVDEALSRVNRALVKGFKSKGAKAVSILSSERLTIKAKRKDNAPCGDFVGDVDSVDAQHLNEAIEEKAIAVVSPLGVDKDGRLYNINADMAAAELATAVSAEKLIILTNVRGVFRQKGDEASLISTLGEDEAQRLIDKGAIDSGMIPKVKAGILALDKGVNKVHIINGNTRHSLLAEVFTDKGIGTEIVGDVSAC